VATNTLDFVGSVFATYYLVAYAKTKIAMDLTPAKWLRENLPKNGSESKTYTYFFAFGFVNGLLPCGLVYAALAAAMVTATPIQGMLFMVFFGLGTMPALTSIIILKSKNNFAWRKYITKSSYYISIFVGVLLILRGLNLGIPYVSPGLNAETQEMSCCHKPKH
jgi:sulfite exporter TauE/SafE